jgi:hypothetical protein
MRKLQEGARILGRDAKAKKQKSLKREVDYYRVEQEYRDG